MVFGGLMTLLGVVLYVVSGAQAPTALIPAAFGVPLIVLGAIAARSGERGRMHTMHAAAMLGLVGAVASLIMLARSLHQWEERKLALTGMALLALLNIAFVGFCVQSFI